MWHRVDFTAHFTYLPRAVDGDPYQLRIYLPDGFAARRAELSEGLAAIIKTDGNLLTVDFPSAAGLDVDWKIFF